MANAVQLLLDEDGLGASLRIAIPQTPAPMGSLLVTLNQMGIWSRVETLTCGAEQWLLYLRLAELDGSRLSPSRASELLLQLAKAIEPVKSGTVAPLRAA